MITDPGGKKITLTEFENKNEILYNRLIRENTGFARMDDGNYLVSMTCPMPSVTKEMIQWWFWWHPQKDERYQMWFPGEHYKIAYSKKDTEYFSLPVCPEFRPNSQFPVERIGGIKMPLRIDFVTPEQFGFSRELMMRENVATIVCGHVGAFKGLVQHTEMAHIFFETEDGLYLVSRFWIGKRLKNKLLRRFILTDSTAGGMAEHCYREYRNLTDMLPDLYFRYGS